MRIEEEQSLSLVLRRSFLFQWDGVKYGWKRNCWFFDFGFIFPLPITTTTTKSDISAKLFGPPALWNGRRTFWPPPTPPSLYLWPNQILYSFYFWKICYFRTTEIFSQHHCGAEICKYVFGSVPVTVFSWCFLFLLVCFSFLPPPPPKLARF